jgi:methionyl-tRNA formyltransferase
MGKRILFMGTPAFAVPSLLKLAGEFNLIGAVSQPDRPAGRGKRIRPTPVKEVALELGLEVFQPRSKSELVGVVRELSPECIVVVAYGMILPKEVIHLPNYGAINLHASLLPKYRGAAPIQRALMSGESKTGNTVMLINERMDAGDILARQEEEIKEEDNYQTLSERLSRRGAELLTDTLRDWFAKRLKPIPQKESEATYAPPIRKEELKICWRAEACSVIDRVRGLFPNAYTTFRGSRIKILSAERVEMEGEEAAILSDKEFVVGCGYGAVKIRELISPKGKRMSGEEFMRGYSPRVGEKLA